VNTATLQSLHVYPLKSARGIALSAARLGTRGLDGDREWLIVNARRRFLTQRELPQLALLSAQPQPQADHLLLSAPGQPPLRVPLVSGERCTVQIWRDECAAIDAGDAAARWLSDWLQHDCRLVRFDLQQHRFSSAQWTGDVQADNAFSDGYPILVIGQSSLNDLNRRLGRQLPMDRFRPNIVLAGLEPHAEDRIHELRIGAARVRLVKPCTRCVITTTDQATGVRDGDEPLDTLRGYRFDAQLRGVAFGQNAIIVAGTGEKLHAGDVVDISWR